MVEMKLEAQPVITMELRSENLLFKDTFEEDAIVSRTVTKYENRRVKEVGNSAFQSADKLVFVDLPAVTKLGGYVFNYCYALSAVNTPKVMFIGNGAFNSCVALETIDLPSLEQLYGGAFAGCTKLTKVILPGPTIPTLYSASFNNTPIESGTGHIFVPDALLDRYKVATNWSAYAEQFRPLSTLEG